MERADCARITGLEVRKRRIVRAVAVRRRLKGSRLLKDEGWMG
jgi:hypothetical protein